MNEELKAAYALVRRDIRLKATLAIEMADEQYDKNLPMAKACHSRFRVLDRLDRDLGKVLDNTI